MLLTWHVSPASARLFQFSWTLALLARDCFYSLGRWRGFSTRVRIAWHSKQVRQNRFLQNDKGRRQGVEWALLIQGCYGIPMPCSHATGIAVQLITRVRRLRAQLAASARLFLFSWTLARVFNPCPHTLTFEALRQNRSASRRMTKGGGKALNEPYWFRAVMASQCRVLTRQGSQCKSFLRLYTSDSKQSASAKRLQRRARPVAQISSMSIHTIELWLHQKWPVWLKLPSRNTWGMASVCAYVVKS